MESRQLRYFLAVAAHGSFTAAAAKIGVAQPALSAQIAKLELNLGCRLFVRRARGITLTAAGEHLHAEAISIINHLLRAEHDTREMGGRRTQECRFGLPPQAASILAVPLIAAVETALPEVHLRILDAMGGTLREWYSDGRLELAMLYRVPNEPLHTAKDVFSEGFYLAALSGSLGAHDPIIGVEELLAIPLVVSTPLNAHRQILDEAARRHGSSLKIAAEIDSLSAQRKLVLMGAGAAVLPLSDFGDWPSDRLDLVPIRRNELTASLLIARGYHACNSSIIQAVERLVVESVHRLVAEGIWHGSTFAEVQKGGSRPSYLVPDLRLQNSAEIA